MSLALALLGLTACAGAPVAVPSFDRVDHAHPEEALVLQPSLGSRETIEEVAHQVVGDTFEQKLTGIGRWTTQHLTYDGTLAYRWRNVDEVLADGRYGGCADQAMVFASLTRALGIPTVLVKAMDVDWIRSFRAGPEPSTWSGHVFLEVHDGERWMLLDASEQLLYEDYDPRARLLPGDRYAYDKGLDPYELVLSVRWEEWKEQTRAYFRDFDVAQVAAGSARPVVGGHRLGAAVLVAGDNPGWQHARDRLASDGWNVGRSGNSGFEDWMPLAVRGTLVVLSVGGDDVLPEPYRSTYVGEGFVELAARHPGDRSWVEERTAEDGTQVVLVFGVDEAALAEAISALDPSARP